MNFFSQVMKSFCKDALIENAVAQSKAEIANTLNQNAAKIAAEAQNAGFKVEADYVDDVDETIEPVIINIQLGHRSKTSQSSQWITVTVYDDTDIKVRITNKIKQIIGESNTYLSFDSLNEVLSYLNRIYEYCK